MNIEEVREFALSMPDATEDMFVEDWLSFRVGGKWFALVWLGAPEPRVAVKLPPAEGEQLRDRYEGVQAAYHMNKRHWNDLYLELLPDALVRELVERSYLLVRSTLPKHGRVK